VNHNPTIHTQPEYEENGIELVEMSTGLVIAVGFILGGMIGSLVGHFMLTDAFGLGQDVIVGGVIGIIVGGLLTLGIERMAIARMGR